jgi:uncharacterized protein YdiU (UPF0061 family)
MSGFQFNHSYITLPENLFSRVDIEKIPTPELILYNSALDTEISLHFADEKNEVLAALFSGQQIPEGAYPIAQAYAGHQFGHFNILGDGRAILLGEHIAPNQKRYDIQFKGSGITPYSRRGDGKATLSAMLREYLYSEAMHGLGIPTTRSLAVVKTGEDVIRQEIHAGAVLTRIASSHIRVGTFEYAGRLQEKETIQALFDYTIQRHFPHLKESVHPALAFLNEVMRLQISLIVEWMRVGFIHGVMNTDNMSIAGETIDYGPCSFMNAYHPDTVFSAIDTQGRYAYGNQPAIAQWNLACLAGALLKLIDDDQPRAIEKAKSILNEFPALYNEAWYAMMGRKTGLINPDSSDQKLIDELLEIMKMHQADYTNMFAYLMHIPVPDHKVYQNEEFLVWQSTWQKNISRREKTESIQSAMRQANPIYILRNYLVEEALDAYTQHQDNTRFNQLLQRMQDPYCYNEKDKGLQQPPVNGDTHYQTYCNT